MNGTCPHCSAVLRQSGARTCEYCGAVLARSAQDPPERGAQVAELVRSVRSHPDFSRWLAFEPPRTSHVRSSAFGVFFGLLFAAVAVMVALTGSMVAGPLVVVPLLFVGAGLWLAWKSLVRTRRASQGAIERLPAYVLDKRVKLYGDGTEGPPQPVTYATLELENGERREVRLPDRQSGLLALGDYGLAFFLDRHLLEFKRVGRVWPA